MTVLCVLCFPPGNMGWLHLSLNFFEYYVLRVVKLWCKVLCVLIEFFPEKSIIYSKKMMTEVCSCHWLQLIYNFKRFSFVNTFTAGRIFFQENVFFFVFVFIENLDVSIQWTTWVIITFLGEDKKSVWGFRYWKHKDYSIIFLVEAVL